MRLARLGSIACLVVGTSAWAPAALGRPAVRCPRCRPPLLTDDDSLQEEINSLNLDRFNKDLYEHLTRRPEYENSEMYAELRKRVDVDDPIYSELKARREMLASSPTPSPTQTPGEVIEIVLRALRDLDWPRPGHGVELLMSYSSKASILSGTGSGEGESGEITAQMLLDYFTGGSSYAILLNWVSINYHKKVQLSVDGRRALQQLRLVSADGTSVPVTFQLAKRTNEEGAEVWLIDQLLVKSLSP